MKTNLKTMLCRLHCRLHGKSYSRREIPIAWLFEQSEQSSPPTKSCACLLRLRVKQQCSHIEKYNNLSTFANLMQVKHGKRSSSSYKTLSQLFLPLCRVQTILHYTGILPSSMLYRRDCCE